MFGSVLWRALMGIEREVTASTGKGVEGFDGIRGGGFDHP